MDALDAIKTRASAAKIEAPGPSPEDLQTILAAGALAPDHGRLSPWRFTVIEGEAREKLASLMAAAQLAKAPDTSAESLEKTRQKAFRAPTIIAIASEITPGTKIPDIEQIMAVAAGVQNMFLAAHALGYGVMWKTGAVAYHAPAKEGLGFGANDQIVALLYLGTLVRHLPGRDVDPMTPVRRL